MPEGETVARCVCQVMWVLLDAVVLSLVMSDGQCTAQKGKQAAAVKWHLET